MKKRSRKKAHKRQESKHEQSFNAKLIQLVSDGNSLYGLDERGRVFAYLDAPVPGWVQIDGDDLKLVLKPIDLDAVGEEHASKLPDDQRHTKTLERNRAASERRREIYQAMEPYLEPLERGMSDVRDMLEDIQKRITAMTANGATGAG